MKAALTAIVTALAVAASAKAEDSRVAAFRAACVGARESFAATKAAILANGWVEVAETYDPRLASIMRVTHKYDSAVVAMGASRVAVGLFAKAAGAQKLFIVLDQMHLPKPMTQADALGCRFYDFDAMSPLDGSEFRTWLGADPSKTWDEPSNAVGQYWRLPTAVPHAAAVSQMFIAKGGSIQSLTGATGLTLQITSFAPKAN